MNEYVQKRFLKLAYHYALRSPDPSTQNGAVVLNSDGDIIGWGCNTFTKGLRVEDKHLERPLKYSYIEHAERNAIYNSFTNVYRNNRPHTIVVAWAACSDCARGIVQSGIEVLIRHKRPGQDRWNDSIAIGDDILKQGRVEIIDVEGELGGCSPVLFNGELIYP